MVFLYRKNGGKVEGVSSDDNAYTGIDATFYGTALNPSTPNGTDLATPKIWDGSAIRNATAPEITAFATALTADTNLIDRAAAKARLQSDPVLKKLLGALVDTLRTQINTLRTSPNQSFPAVTQATVINAILANIDSGSFD